MPSGVQQTSTPCGRSSAHSPSAKLCWNALTAEYIASVAEPARHASDATRTIPPRPRSRIAHRAAEMVCQRDGPDAVQLDLLQRVVDLVVQERRGPIRGARVVDHQADIEADGRIG